MFIAKIHREVKNYSKNIYLNLLNILNKDIKETPKQK